MIQILKKAQKIFYKAHRRASICYWVVVSVGFVKYFWKYFLIIASISVFTYTVFLFIH